MLASRRSAVVDGPVAPVAVALLGQQLGGGRGEGGHHCGLVDVAQRGGRVEARPRPGGVAHPQLQLGPLEVQVQPLSLHDPPVEEPGEHLVAASRSDRAG